MKNKILFALVALIGFGPMTATAGLIEVDLVAGDGLLIRDTNNSREWLDVTATMNISVNAALALYAPLGFQIATSNDVIQLFTAAGIPDIPIGLPLNNPSDPGTSGTVANRAPVEALLALMNHAPPYAAASGNPWIHGYTDYGSATNVTLSRFAAFTSDNIGRANVNSNGTRWTYNTVHSSIGTYLVRNTTVPEPGTLALMVMGFAGMGFAGRKTRA